MKIRNSDILTFVLIITLIYSYPALSQQDDLKNQLLKLNQIVRTAKDKHLTDVEANVLIDAAIRGLIQKLDPHSYYFSPDEMRAINARRTGNLYGIGINYFIAQDTLTIVSVKQNGPAFKTGLQTGDKIISINNKNTVGLHPDSIEAMLSGDIEGEVRLEVLPFNRKGISLHNIKFQKLPYYSVDASFLLDGTDIGYISINRFMATTQIEMTDSLSLLSDMGMKKLIIDLRGNPGGILEQAYLTADEFIADGNTILMTKGRETIYNEIYRSSKGGKYEKIPLILLVDLETASAPEIFAGAIQDLDRGLVIGEPTFGKGLVQRPYEFFDGSELWLTVAQYYTPSGRSIQKEYQNNESYGTLEDRIVLRDGLNLSHSVELLPEYGYSDNKPIYKTKSGRTVVGGGGITPDYIIKNDSVGSLAKELVAKNILQKYSVKYVRKWETNLKLLYEKDFPGFLHNFIITDQMLCDMLNVSNASQIEGGLDEISDDKEYLKVLIKSWIAGILWDSGQMKQILIENSKHIKKAVELMPMAERVYKGN